MQRKRNINKLLLLLPALAMVAVLLVIVPTAASAEDIEVSDAAQLNAAILEVPDNTPTIIKITNSFDTGGQSIVIENKIITLDIGDYYLTFGDILIISNSTVDFIGVNGKLSATAGFEINDNSTASFSSLAAADPYSYYYLDDSIVTIEEWVYLQDYSSVEVANDSSLTVNGYFRGEPTEYNNLICRNNSEAIIGGDFVGSIYAYGRSTVTVNGDVKGGGVDGPLVTAGDESEIIIYGNLESTAGGAEARNGTVIVRGNIYSLWNAAEAYNRGYIAVEGSISMNDGSYNTAVTAYADGFVFVAGNIMGSAGNTINAGSNGSVIVGGDITFRSDIVPLDPIIWVQDGGEVKIDGTVMERDGVYIIIGWTERSPADFDTPTTLNDYLTYSDGISTVWVADNTVYVCEIDGIRYASLDAALGTVPDWEHTTISLLTDIYYSGSDGGVLNLISKNITFKLNGYDLFLSTGAYGLASTIDYIGYGSFEINGPVTFAYGSYTFSCYDNGPGLSADSCEVIIYGNLTAKSDDRSVCAVSCRNSTVEIYGDVKSSWIGIYYYGVFTTNNVTVHGNITADSTGVQGSNGNITVYGNVTCANYGIASQDSSVFIDGDVTATVWWAVYAVESDITITGNATGGCGIIYAEGGSMVTVYGNAASGGWQSPSDPNFEVRDGSWVKIDGTLDAWDGVCVRAGGFDLMRADFTIPTTQYCYITYTDEISTVWVADNREYVCEIDGIGYATLDEALFTVPNDMHTTISLLTDIYYSGGDGNALTLLYKNITFELNGYDLRLSTGAYFYGCTVDYFGSGSFEINGPASFAYGFYSFSCYYDGRGLYANGCVLVVNGDVTALSEGGYAAVYGRDSAVEIYGNVKGTQMGVASENGGVTVYGDVTADGTGVWGLEGNITVYGNVTCAYYGIDSQDSSVFIDGDVTATSWWAVYSTGGDVTITGNATGGIRIIYAEDGAAVIVNGNAAAGGGMSLSDPNIEVWGGSWVRIDGTFNALQGVFVRADGLNLTPDDFTVPTMIYGYLTYTNGFSIVLVADNREYVCEIDGIGYATLDEALFTVPNDVHTTISLLTDIYYSGGNGDALTLINKNITFELNGYDLRLSTGAFFYASTIDYFGPGSFEINGPASFAYGFYSFNCYCDGRGLYANSCVLVVNGDVTALSEGGYAAVYGRDSVVEIYGNVKGTQMGVACENGGVTVYGDVTADGTGVWGLEGNITVYGNVTCALFGIDSQDSTVFVDGDVTATSWWAVYSVGGDVTITGNATGGIRIIYAEDGAAVIVNGNAAAGGGMSLSDPNIEVWGGSWVRIDGTFNALQGVFIRADGLDLTPDDFTIPTMIYGYLTYTDGFSTVLVPDNREYVCEIGGIGYATLDEALITVPDSMPTTVSLLTDIYYSGGDGDVLILFGKNVTFELNGYDLCLSTGVFFNDSFINYVGPGSFEINGPATFLDSSCKFSCYDNGNGFSAYGSKIVVYGDVTAMGGNYSAAIRSVNSVVEIWGNVTGYDDGIQAYGGMVVVYQGDVYGRLCGIRGDEGSIVSVEGSVTSDYWAVYAYDCYVAIGGNATGMDGGIYTQGTVIVNGSVTGNTGVVAVGATVMIGSDLTAYIEGVEAIGNSSVRVDGAFTSEGPYFVVFYEELDSEAFFVSRSDKITPSQLPGYDEYSHWDAVVWIKSVKEETPIGIIIAMPPYKTDYTVGEALDLYGIFVIAVYSNGSIKDVTDFTADPAEGTSLDTVGVWIVTISYTEDDMTFASWFYITVEALPHVHDYAMAVTDPTCTEDGYTTYTCSCGDEYVDDILPALGHDFVLVEHKDATGTEDGYDLYVCSRCGETMTVVIPATGVTLTGVSTSAKDFISITETSKNSGVYVLVFNVTETYSDGTTKVVTYSVEINANNANVSGSCDLGAFTLVYDIKGNGSNIKEFRVVLN